MKKLKLNLDDLKVNSFQLVNSIMNEKGTVVGNMEAPMTTQTGYTDCTCPSGCNDSCYNLTLCC